MNKNVSGRIKINEMNVNVAEIHGMGQWISLTGKMDRYVPIFIEIMVAYGILVCLEKIFVLIRFLFLLRLK